MENQQKQLMSRYSSRSTTAEEGGQFWYEKSICDTELGGGNSIFFLMFTPKI